jgi:hypothetical protein
VTCSCALRGAGRSPRPSHEHNKGFLFTKETAIPISLIASVDDGAIYLAVDADDQRLQPA